METFSALLSFLESPVDPPHKGTVMLSALVAICEGDTEASYTTELCWLRRCCSDEVVEETVELMMIGNAVTHVTVMVSGQKHKHTAMNYRQISNISRTKSQNLIVSCLVFQLSLHIPQKPGVKSTMMM